MHKLTDKFGAEVKLDSIVAIAQTYGQSAIIRKGKIIELRFGSSIWNTRMKMSWIEADGTTAAKATWCHYDPQRIILLES